MDKLVEYLIIIQARTNSTRLPAKIMLDLAGKPLLQRVYESVNKATKVQKAVVATSIEKSDDIVKEKLDSLNIECFRGSLDNVLNRFYECALKYKAKNIVRVTADNPLVCPKLIDKQIELFENKKCDYVAWKNSIYGLATEVFSFQALKEANEKAKEPDEFEHVTPYMKKNLKTVIGTLDKKYEDNTIRITVDTLDDYIKMQKFFLYCEKTACQINIDEYLEYL